MEGRYERAMRISLGIDAINVSRLSQDKPEGDIRREAAPGRHRALQRRTARVPSNPGPLESP